MKKNQGPYAKNVILLIDNYDSFVHNLARYFRLLGEETVVVRNDQIDTATAQAMQPAGIVLSPGPCTPAEAGCCLEIVQELHQAIPILGICLGHQAIGAALGARIIRAERPVHGQASVVQHTGKGLFDSLPGPLKVGRYHSLVVERESLPTELEVTAWTEDGTVMAIEHQRYPVAGVQFHPESILTEAGLPLLENWLQAVNERFCAEN